MDLNDTTILLTGGTGSFGSAFVRRVTERWPRAVIRVYSRDELKQSEMRIVYGDDQVRYLIGDVRDRSRMTRAAQSRAAHFVDGFIEGGADAIASGTYFALQDQNPMQTRAQIRNAGVPIRYET